jgi:hypothetical protein
VREVVERTVVNPSPQDILRIRREAQDAVVAAGASPEKIEVAIEIDAQRNLVRASASGATEIAQSSSQPPQTAEQLLKSAARLFHADADNIERIGDTDGLAVFSYGRYVRVLDRNGVGRLALRDALLRRTTAQTSVNVLGAAVEEATAFGDVGRALPDIYLLHGARIADFSGLAAAEQALALAQEELQGRAPNAPVLILAVSRSA